MLKSERWGYGEMERVLLGNIKGHNELSGGERRGGRVGEGGMMQMVIHAIDMPEQAWLIKMHKERATLNPWAEDGSRERKWYKWGERSRGTVP